MQTKIDKFFPPAAPAKPPVDHVVASSKLRGFAPSARILKGSMAGCGFTAEFVVDIMNTEGKGFTTCKLLSSAYAISDSQIKHEPVDGTAETAPLLDEQDAQDEIVILYGFYCLMTPKTGQFRIKLDFQVPCTLSEAKALLKLEVPRATTTELSFTVPEPDVAINVTPAVDVRAVKSPQTADKSVVACVLPVCTNVQVTWVPKTVMQQLKAEKQEKAYRLWLQRGADLQQEESHKRKERVRLEEKKWAEVITQMEKGKKDAHRAQIEREEKERRDQELEDLADRERQQEKVVTAGVDILVGLLSGHIVLQYFVNFTVTAGVVDYFECLVPDGHGSAVSANALQDNSRRKAKLTVVDITGSCLEKWETIMEAGVGMRIRLFTKEQKMNSTTRFVIQAEMETAATSYCLRMPAMRCMVPHCSRVKGYIGVRSHLTNIQVRPMTTTALLIIDNTELPDNMNKMKGILHAYRFIIPTYALELEVTQHNDMAVVAAVVEKAVYVITRSENKVLYKLKLQIANTNMQFAKLLMPSPDCTLWTLTVNSEAVKPAVDGGGSVLLPLLNNHTGPFNIEVVFQMVDCAMSTDTSNNHNLTLHFPTLDIPINHLLVSVFLPEKYHYAEFRGDLLECENGWSCSELLSGEKPPAPVYSGGGYPNVEICAARSYQKKKKAAFLSTPSFGFRAKRAEATFAGVKPMQVDTGNVTQGKNFLFERLFVENQPMVVEVEYRAEKRKEKRRLQEGSGCLSCCTVM
eukprot:TRINITY_DN62276_c0_g1_i1.p1 TRINITY_DN62276_c0_g1~~TRINITY_DN62276_c0_g1_i1.p1  ORF type:complete len:747 (-),score=55.89 TRINITY_DN62276_c0_g1_i1:1548-3788(-)